jgi:pyruvate formate-lyase/glycerol dehydratase family glycyl radical enzyme
MNDRVRKNKNEYMKRKNEENNVRVTCFYMDQYMESLEEVPVLREARALQKLWENAEIQLYSDEIIAGRLICREPVRFHYGNGTDINRGLAEEFIVQEKMTKQQEDEFRKNLDIIEKKRYVPSCNDIFTLEEQASIDAVAATSTFFGGHMVMDHEYILARGLKGIEEDIVNYRLCSPESKSDFYEAMHITLEGIRKLILRYSEKAAEVARQEKGEVKERFDQMSKDLFHISGSAPETFRQAIQLAWFIHMISDCDSFGRFDQYLFPFFKTDIACGRLDMEEALELIEGFWIKIDEDGAIQNMTIGGVDRAGELAYNDLTMLCLLATREMNFKGPNLCLRIDDRMYEEFWKITMDNLGTGQGLPALYNDRIIIDFLTGMGIPLEDARDFCLAGCSQVMIPGRSNFVNDIGVLNVAKCLELTYMSGIDPLTGKKVGLETGEVEQFRSFDEFVLAFKKQLEYFCQMEADINNKDIIYRREREGYAVRTLFVSDCLKRGMGVYHGGARYNSVQLECLGITNAADSLMAIKDMVFEKHMISFRELIEALKLNFQGNEPLRLHLLNNIPKFGNDVPEVDEIRKDISDFVFKEMRRQKGAAGGNYIPGEVIFVAHEWAGNSIGATPDGRLAREVLADSAGASQGRDKEGPTALLNSVLQIPVDAPLTSVVLNMKFMKSMWNEVNTNIKIRSLFKSFFKRGGMQLQVNVCDAETLKLAMQDPEKYSSLVVRVGGYSAYFTTLSRTLQEEIIKRTEYC